MSLTSEFKQWELRSQSWFFGAVFLICTVVLNPMIWYLGWFDTQKTRLFNDKDLIAVLVLANTLMSGATFAYLRKVSKFNLFHLGLAVFVGFLIAIFSTPIVFPFFFWVGDMHSTFEELITVLSFYFVFGWPFAAYFAATYGLLCAISVYFIVILLCRPVNEDSAPTSN